MFHTIIDIYGACRLLNNINIFGNIEIFVDNQAAILSLKSHTYISPQQCKEELIRRQQLFGITKMDHCTHELAQNISYAELIAFPLGIIKISIQKRLLM